MIDLHKKILDASYYTAWDMVKKFGAFFFVRRDGISGHIVTRRSKNKLNESDIASMYAQNLKKQIEQKG